MVNLHNKRVLLVNAPFMDIEVDVKNELEKKGAVVTFLPTKTSKANPFNRRANNKLYNEKDISKFLDEKRIEWINLLNKEEYSGAYDYVFVLKCLEFHPIFLDIMRQRNPSVKALLYLYDTIDGGFQIDRFLKYYDKTYSFDSGDCKKYGIKYLPIFWTDENKCSDIKYDIFGYGNSVGGRYDIYKTIRSIARKNGLSENIHLFGSMFTCMGAVKYIIKRILKDKNQGKLKDIYDGFFQSVIYSPKEFRNCIMESKVTLDTVIPGQNGLTARFMWALGANKKIITNNVAVKENDFYSPEQIFIIENNYDMVVDFVRRQYVVSPKTEYEIQKYRIDNWINTIFED